MLENTTFGMLPHPLPATDAAGNPCALLGVVATEHILLRYLIAQPRGAIVLCAFVRLVDDINEVADAIAKATLSVQRSEAA